MRELILGGQKSGKSRRAEALAAEWLARDPMHQAVLIATAKAGDPEMAARIERHQVDRQQLVPRMRTVEEPLYVAEALSTHSQVKTLVVVDCIPLWLTNWWMPVDNQLGSPSHPIRLDWDREFAMFIEAFGKAGGPVLLVSNEIGLGVIPLGKEVRAFVDRLGSLNQALAAKADRVTLMAAGLPLFLKGRA